MCFAVLREDDCGVIDCQSVTGDIQGCLDAEVLPVEEALGQ